MALWDAGSSLLIYQHFARVKRAVFLQRKRQELASRLNGSHIEAFTTPHILFLLALQQDHQYLHQAIMADVHFRWNNQISFANNNQQADQKHNERSTA
jgi:hypothetical protein